ncbi:MAG: PspC domain-containing protein [Gammaproteobacteria bacterium]|nr:PspC domain-containing protein [Gammaproteobacteria bacterium]MBU1555063.1 PspC domain-containing protein [Gammaproteobacteria bacterium]MBU2070389.1 PspC domain-containing protein [Gammaproteobacteria bacterium]MBU2184749.1 PspC domain-containing protein [Gammaproteobacteria bacterium]MBU2203664.1 PspC domain-containing protein [Gammaproteobacteria bacterium]
MASYDTDRWYCARAFRKVSGVCAGFAGYYQQPRWLIRILAVALLLMFPIATIVAYLVAAVVLPDR